MCRSPKLIAAYRVLHRLRVPRHPPSAFIHLTTTVVKQSTRDLQRVISVCASEDAPQRITSMRFYYHEHFHVHCQTAGSAQPPEGGRRNGHMRIEMRSGCERRRLTGSAFVPPTLRSARPTRCSVKEVIQPQVPLRLPCYDFAPVTALAFGGLAPCGFRHRLRALTASMA